MSLFLFKASDLDIFRYKGIRPKFILTYEIKITGFF